MYSTKLRRTLIVLVSWVLISLAITRPVYATNVSFNTIAWSPDGREIAASDNTGTLYIWNVATRYLAVTIKNSIYPIDAIAWRPDSEQIATLSSQDGIVRLWHADTGQPAGELQEIPNTDSRGMLAWSPDGTKLATAIFTSDGTLPVHIWSVEKGNNQLLSTSQRTEQVFDISWSPDSSRLAVANYSGLYVLNNLSNPHPDEHVLAAPNFMFWVAWSPDGNKLATASIDDSLYILNANTGQELAQLTNSQQKITALAWSPLGNRLASLTTDTLSVWDSNSGRLLDRFPAATPNIPGKALSWSPFGGRLAYPGPMDSNAASRSLTLASNAIQVVVPYPSQSVLVAITNRCVTQHAIRQTLLSLIALTTWTDFISTVNKLSAAQTPPACAADMIQVANAMQKSYYFGVKQ